MFWSDEKTLDYTAILLLVALPWLATAGGLWNIIIEMILFMAVFLTGRKKGFLLAAILLGVGYGIAALSFRWPGLTQMGFIPWSGLIAVWGWQRHWREREVLFWSLMAAALFGALPVIGFASQGIQPQMVHNLANSLLQQYKEAGFLTALQQQGITENQVRIMLEQSLNVFILITPAMAGITGFVELSLSYLIYKKVFDKNRERIPFTRWRLPWYAIWGAILAIALYLLGDQFSWPLIRGVGINLMVAYGALALALGTTLYVYFLQSSRVPRLLKWVLIFVNIFSLFASVVSVMMFGLFDMVLNFRRLPESEEGLK